LVAFNHFQIGNYKASHKCLENLKKIADKTKQTNAEIEEAGNELYSEIMKLKNTKGELTDSTNLDDDYDEKYELEEEMNID
jgi:hypothetical protein